MAKKTPKNVVPRVLPPFAHLNDLDVYREELHGVLIGRLKELYGKEKAWKYAFIKNVKEKFNQTIQYQQLNEFEVGKSRSENIILLMMLEIISIKSEIEIKVLSEGADFFNISVK